MIRFTVTTCLALQRYHSLTEAIANGNMNNRQRMKKQNCT